MASVVAFVVTYAFEIAVVAALAYSYVQQQQAAADAKARQEQMKREADERADQAKGTQIVIAGEVSTLRVIYGRNLVGGIRCYHNTFNSFTASYDTSNFALFKASGALDGSISGSKHEFLIIQQAICFGGIERVHAVDVDDRKIDGENVNAYNEVVYDGSGTRISPFEHGAVVTVNCGGTLADPTCYANDGARATALFTNIAYSTGVFRTNRDDPQYGGPPKVQFYAEGMKVKFIFDNAGVKTLSAFKRYSNNPALCLLDYLMSPLYGKGLTLSQIDLESFYRAYRICEVVIASNIPLEGKLWRGKGGTRAVKRFECNLGLDSNSTLRSNVEMILDTMEGANLLWSGGTYKLVLDYPTIFSLTATYSIGDVVQFGSNEAVDLYECISQCVGQPVTDASFWKLYTKAELTDDDLIRDAETTISWPNAQTRLNFCTVRYLNEAKDFKEDTVSWPNKNDAIYSTYLAQDSQIQLETEMFATGISSYYHALAKAEAKVRQSRTATTYEFSVNRDFVHLEPGDFIKLRSDVLGVPGELLKITAVDPDGTGKIKISSSKFDANDLAWNIGDSEYVPPRNLYNNTIANIPASDISLTLADETPTLSWPAIDDSRVNGYTVYTTANYIGDETVWVDRGTVSTLSFTLPATYIDSYFATVVPVTANGRKSPKAGWPIKTIPYARLSKPANLRVDVVANGLSVSWSPNTSRKLSEYEIRVGGANWSLATSLANQKATDYLFPFRGAGTYTVRVKAIDINGAESDESTLAVTVTAPGSSALTPTVVDNNVMLYWSSAPTMQPIVSYEIRRGDTYAGSALVGTVAGLFSTFFEMYGGRYRYWVTPIDAGGNYGTPSSTVLDVTQPPDYHLRNDIYSTLGNSLYSVFTSGGGVSYLDSYIVSGYFDADYVARPTRIPTSGWVQEIFDTGEGSVVNITSSRAAVTLDYVVTSGTPVITVVITSSLDGSTYSAAIAGDAANIYSFRYVKIRIEVTGGAITLNRYNLKLSSRLVKESNTVNCLADDSGGTTVNFTRSYVDVTSISVTPIGNTPVFAIYDFTDVPNPTSFKILLFDRLGNRINGNASYTVEGVN